MPHQTELIGTIAMGFSAAFVAGLIAQRLRLPLIVGYLLAGVAVGPFTPGFVSDANLSAQLAEIGVILLMFGVGNHFSIGDLLSVWKIALPGAIGQIAVATVLGIGLASLWGWSVGEGLVFGLALSVASTVVLLRALTQAGLLTAPPGRVAVGWLVVEDLVTVLALVLLPILATSLGGQSPAEDDGSLLVTLAVTFGELVLFVVLMLVAGVRIIPWILQRVAGTGSRELFILATLAAALGIAFGASELFGVSFALGAFLAGVVVNESELSHRAAEEALPLSDAFAVLFFVSVGMLIEPAFLIDEIGMILLVAAVIIIGKAVAALVIVKLLGGPLRTGLVVAAGLSQIGEFSFILAELGTSLDLLPATGRSLILAGALISISLNPLLFATIGRVLDRFAPEPALAVPSVIALPDDSAGGQ